MRIATQLWLSTLLLILNVHAADSPENRPEEQHWATSIFFDLPLELQYKITAYVLGGDIKQKLFKPTLLHILQQPKNRVGSVAFSPNNQHIATASNHSVDIWDVNTAQLMHTLQNGSKCVSFNCDGSRIACLSNNSPTLNIYDTVTNQIYSSNNCGELIMALAFSPNGTEIICADFEGMLHIYNTVTSQKICTFKANTINIRSIAFNSDGSLIATTAAGDNTVDIFNALTGLKIDVLPHKNFALSAAFHPYKDWIASGCADKYAYLWDRLTKKIIHKCKHTDWVSSVAFSPDGSLIASGSHDQTVRIWDTITGEQLHILNGHTGTIGSVTFNSNGSLLASASRDGTVRIWDTLSQYEKYVRNIDLAQAVWISHEYQTAQGNVQPQNRSGISAKEKREQIIRKLAIEHSIAPALVSRIGALKSHTF